MNDRVFNWFTCLVFVFWLSNTNNYFNILLTIFYVSQSLKRTKMGFRLLSRTENINQCLCHCYHPRVIRKRHCSWWYVDILLPLALRCFVLTQDVLQIHFTQTSYRPLLCESTVNLCSLGGIICGLVTYRLMSLESGGGIADVSFHVIFATPFCDIMCVEYIMRIF